MSSDPRAASAAVLDLVTAAGRAASREEWLFLLTNRSVAVTPYDRASVWGTRGTSSLSGTLLAVSGANVPDKDGAFASQWKNALKRLRHPQTSALLAADSFTGGGDGGDHVWNDVKAATPALSALWIPVKNRELAFVFERWDESAPFTETDRRRLEQLVEACSFAWRGGGRRAPSKWGRRLTRLVVLLAAAAALVFVRLPLRIAAECEVAAKNPRLVAAPMDGVIAEVVAEPGARVAAGAPLAAYDARMMEEERNILRRQVGVAEAELATARARGFAEQSFRAETSRLEARLEQERARLQALEVRYAQRVIDAPVDGMVQLDDPRAWRGRPVATGEAILWLVEPADTRLKIWLPQDDRIDFDPERLVGVHLYALGSEARSARLSYVSTFAQPTGDGGYAFPAEAEWVESEGSEKAPSPQSPPLGLRGTAFLYGEEVSLGYWLARRPLGWLRRWFGV